MKKRMKKKVRNDFEEHDEFETQNIIVQGKSMLTKELIGTGFVGIFALFCMFNRRKGASNPIYLVSDNDYESPKKTKNKKKKR